MALTLTNDILKFRESTSDPWERLLIQANMNFNLIYPVGSIYMSTVNVDPGTIFGGTWERLKDRFLLGAGDTYTAGDTGGEATHTLTVDEMPNHNHTVPRGSNIGTTNWGIVRFDTLNTSADEIRISKTGGDQPHNNMPPYLVVYMWRRLTLSPTIYTPPANVLIGDVASEDIVPISKGGTGATTRLAAVQNLKTLDLMLGTEIPDNSDLNNYTTPGTYYCANGTSAATLSNIPSDISVGFKLVVYYKGSDANINQELYPNGSEDFYIRYKQAGTWYNWKRVLDTTDLPLSIANGGTGTISAHSASDTLHTMYIHSPLTEITANSNLDNYKTPSSTYYVSNGTVASTIVNGPTTEAGYRLVVMYGTGSSNIRQIAVVNGGNETYSRHYTASKGTWTDWGRLLDTNDLPLSVANGGTGATTATGACANIGAFDLDVTANAIASGDNLNDYKTVGTYFCATNAIATNLNQYGNCPTKRAFKMIVMHSASSTYLLQIIYDYRGEAMWQRWYSSTWSSWYKYSSDVASSSTVNTTYGGVTQTGGCVVKKIGNVVQCDISHGNGTAFSGLTGIDSICTIPSGYRPTATVILPIVARDNGTWASANYVTAILRVSSTGAADIRQNKNVMGTMKYITGAVTWLTDE